jgi:hypothetical protein
MLVISLVTTKIKTIKAPRNKAHGKLESEMKHLVENRAKVASNSKRQNAAKYNVS